MSKSPTARVLIVDDEQDLRDGLAETLRGEGYTVDTASDGWQALDHARQTGYDVALVDLKMPGPDGLLVLDGIQQVRPDTQVIVITGHATVESAVSAMKAGAFDYVPKPFRLDQVRLVVSRAIERKHLEDENRRLRQEVASYRQPRQIIGNSAALQEVLTAIDRVAPSASTILLLGETGTGKELAARAIHELSPRRENPFVALSCGAINESLLESQLFGHVRGAFTGAIEDREGVFEAASGGTLFLDEIGEVSPAMQARLLRALQEREIQRLGETTTRTIDVRLVAATHRDLDAEVQSGRFRQDLFYRLDVATLRLPPLRERRDDVPALADHFLQRLAREMGRPAPTLTNSAQATLCAHDWPGNVRELENAMERALLFQDGDTLDEADLSLTGPPGRAPASPAASAQGQSLQQMEAAHIARVLADCAGNQTKAAQILGIGRRTLYRKLRDYGIGAAEE